MCKKVLSLVLVIMTLFSLVSIATTFAATEGITVTDNKNKANGIYVGGFGDSDGNDTVNIKDATNIQKYAAGMVSFTQRSIAVSDVDGNDTINVRDATAIQKYLAGISVKADIGKYLYITGAHTHNHILGDVIPKCEDTTYEVYSCICGDEYQGKEIPAAGHKYSATVTAPTCTADGYTTYRCSKCNHSFKDKYIESTGHNYTAKVVAPTCKEQGYTLYTCSGCNNSYKDNYTSGGSHNYVSGKCTVCGAAQPVSNSKATAFDTITNWMKKNSSKTSDGEAYGLYTPIEVSSGLDTAVFYYIYENTLVIYCTQEETDLSTWVTVTRGSSNAEFVFMIADELMAEGTFAVNSITDNTSSLNCTVLKDDYGVNKTNPTSIKELAAACVTLALSTYNYYDVYFEIPSSLQELGFTNYKASGTSSKPVTDTKAKAFDDLVKWIKGNGSKTKDGESYIVATSIPNTNNLSTALFYNIEDNTIEMFVDDSKNDLGAWVTFTRGSSYADYVLVYGDYLTAEGSFSVSSITENTSTLGYSYTHNPVGFGSTEIKQLSAAAVKLALTSYGYYEVYYSLPTSLYELGFTNFD